MRDRLIELCREAQTKYLEEDPPVGNFCSYLADRLLANGVIVQLCKVGDTVWFELYGQVESAVVYHCTYELSHRGFIVSGAYAKDTRGLEVSFNENSIGKTVFLTREEAERALKGGGE